MKNPRPPLAPSYLTSTGLSIIFGSSIFRGISSPADSSQARSMSRLLSHSSTRLLPNVGSASSSKFLGVMYSTNDPCGTRMTFFAASSSVRSRSCV